MKTFGAPALAFLALASCVDLGPGNEPPPSAVLNRLTEAYGHYEVVRLGPAPVAGAVIALAVNDSNVVAGYVETTVGERPFRWRGGAFELLGTGGSSTGRAVDINHEGTAVGMAGQAVLWNPGETAPTPIFTSPPADLPNPVPSRINRFGAITGVADDYYQFYLAPSTHQLVYTMGFSFPAWISDSGDVAGRCGNEGVCARLALPGAFPVGSVASTYYPIGPVAMNSRGDALFQGYVSHGVNHYFRRLLERTSTGWSASAEDFADSGDWYAMNADRWAIGILAGAAVIAKIGEEGHLEIDQLTRSSSVAWQVTKTLRITDTGTLLVSAREGPGLPEERLLLIPKR